MPRTPLDHIRSGTLRHVDGSIDIDFYRQAAHRQRRMFIASLLHRFFRVNLNMNPMGDRRIHPCKG
jgi:hypothetical protein